MIELYYPAPEDPAHEARLTAQVVAAGGRLDFREPATALTGICLTFEFDEPSNAEAIYDILRRQGEHVEGVGAYGD